MAEQQYVSTSSEEKFNVVAKAIKTAAEMVHCYNIFQAKTKKIDDILCLKDKETLWKTLQEYLKEYGAFINNTTIITGFYIYQVSVEQYNAMTTANIKMQLEQLKNIVIVKEILHSVYQKSFKECLKKILQGTGLFSKEELDIAFDYL